MIRSRFTVDLYVYAAHEVALWEPIWWQLRRRGVDAQFVVEPPGVNRARGSVPDPANGWRDDKTGSTIDDLMNDDIFATVCSSLQRRGLPWLESARLDADAMVTTSGIGWFSAYRGLRIRTMYGVGAVVDSYGHGPVNEGLDLVLSHGPMSTQAIRSRSPLLRVETVGFPKWANQRGNGRSREEARAELGLVDSGKPVVAWLPTWAHNSSLDRFADALADLATDHLVVAKPHHNNLRFERSRLAQIDPSIVVLDELDTLVPLIVAADVVISDVRSGGTTEALLGDRPVVGLSSDGPLADQGLLVGFDDAVACCDEPADLRTAIASASAPERASARQRWSAWFFGPGDGSDTERAAQAIIDRIDEARRQIDPGPSLADLDSLLTQADAAPELREAAFCAAWPTWSSDHRVGELLDSIVPDASVSTLEACASFVRLTGHLDLCPLRRRWADPDAPIDERLAAAAVAAVSFGDDEAAGAFIECAVTTPPAAFERCLIAILSHEPSLLPAFTSHAGANPESRDDLAIALRDIGADRAEIDLLLAA